MQRTRLPVLLAAMGCFSAQADEVIYYRDWVQVKSATAVLQLPALQRVVRQFEAEEGSKMVVRHPGGDEGSAWAVELRDWLVSLGIGSADIRLEPASGIPQAIVVKAESGAAP